MLFQGTITALVTPFREGKVDLEALESLVERQIAGGVDGLVVCGTTGEAATLTDEEYEEVVGKVVEKAAGRVPVIAGTGTNSTARTLQNTARAARLGVDGVLVVTPYYNKPTQEGLYRHFRAVAEAVDLPVVLYNVPSRTGCNLAPRTAARLAELENVVALKEASGSWQQIYDVIDSCGDRIAILSGDDALAFPAICAGAQGVVSVASNVVPEQMAALVRAARKGELAKARELHYVLLPLFRALFVETNPIPAKKALALLGLCTPEVRLPLWEMAEDSARLVEQVLADLELLGKGTRSAGSE